MWHCKSIFQNPRDFAASRDGQKGHTTSGPAGTYDATVAIWQSIVLHMIGEQCPTDVFLVCFCQEPYLSMAKIMGVFSLFEYIFAFFILMVFISFIRLSRPHFVSPMISSSFNEVIFGSTVNQKTSVKHTIHPVDDCW